MASFLAISLFVKSQVVNFEDLALQPNSYWNGSDNSGGFYSGQIAFFPNTFTDWGGGITSWDGFAYSNMLDTVTQNYTNQYSCYAGHQTPNSTIFAISYNSIDWLSGQTIPNFINFNENIKISSIDVTNTTYAALTMLNGDAYSKKFGGDTGDDPDWFKLTINGYLNDSLTGTVEFYLADYRFADNSQDYILKEWETIDLSSLGTINKLSFTLSSSDTGQFGMNTPAYFCFDNITYQNTSNIVNLNTNTSLTIYPNPAINALYINKKVYIVNIYNSNGCKVLTDSNKNSIDISSLPSGLYVVELIFSNNSQWHKFVKR